MHSSLTKTRPDFSVIARCGTCKFIRLDSTLGTYVCFLDEHTKPTLDKDAAWKRDNPKEFLAWSNDRAEWAKQRMVKEDNCCSAFVPNPRYLPE